VHITCNRFENLVSKNSAVRAMWINPGRSGSKTVRGGVFANNHGGNFQSKNVSDDADVVVLQGHAGKQIKDRPFLIMANRFVNAGKRLVKWQTGNSKALSNYYHWKDASGPLGRRAMAGAIATFTSNNIARNNHLKYSAKGELPQAMFSMMGGSVEDIGDNNHFNCNLVEYDVDVPFLYTSSVLLAQSVDTEALSGHEYTNSSFTNNVIVGPGRWQWNFWFGKGWHFKSSGFTHKPNSWGRGGRKGMYNFR